MSPKEIDDRIAQLTAERDELLKTASKTPAEGKKWSEYSNIMRKYNAKNDDIAQQRC